MPRSGQGLVQRWRFDLPRGRSRRQSAPRGEPAPPSIQALRAVCPAPRPHRDELRRQQRARHHLQMHGDCVIDRLKDGLRSIEKIKITRTTYTHATSAHNTHPLSPRWLKPKSLVERIQQHAPYTVSPRWLLQLRPCRRQALGVKRMYIERLLRLLMQRRVPPRHLLRTPAWPLLA